MVNTVALTALATVQRVDGNLDQNRKLSDRGSVVLGWESVVVVVGKMENG